MNMMCKIFKITILLFKKILLIVIQHFKSSTKTIAFYSHPDISDNSFALFQFLYTTLNDDWHFYWVVENKEVAKHILIRDIANINLNRVTFLYANKFITWIITRFSFFQFDTHGAPYEKIKRSRTVSVSLWHGSPLKAIGNAVLENSVINCPDYLCSGHNIFNKIFSKSLNIPEINIVTTGYPRNDWLTGKMLSSNTVNIDGCYVVWMPTYASSSCVLYKKTYMGVDSDLEHNSLGCILIDELIDLDKYLTKINLKVIIKLHSHDDRNAYKNSLYQNIMIIKGNDERMFGSGLYGLLFRSSALITDCSSIIFDYAITNKPIAIDMTSIASYVRPLNLNIINENNSLYKIFNYSDLCLYLSKVLDNPIPSDEINNRYNFICKDSFCSNVSREVGLL